MSKSLSRSAVTRSPKTFPAPRRKLLSLLVAHALSMPLAAQAATIEVTSTADDGSGCTLREAVATINAGADQSSGCVNSGAAYGTNDAIVFGVGVAGQTITLGGSQIEITANVQINEGGTSTTIDANNGSRILYIGTAGTTASVDQLVLTGANAGSGYGGAILVRNGATFAVKNSTLTGNTAEDGGGLAGFTGATVTVQNSMVSGNSADYGGGLEAFSGSKLVVVDSTVTGNTAGVEGGGIFTAFNTSLEVSNSTISSNTANDDGGGIQAIESSTVTLTDTTVSGNTASKNGGVGVYDSVLTLDRSTVSGNSAASGAAVFVDGSSASLDMINSTISGNTMYAGLVLLFYNTGNIVNSTITGNSVDDNSAGLFVYFGATANLLNTIIANTTYAGNSYSDCSVEFGGEVNAEDDSIIESDNCGTSTMNALNVDPDLLALADNGGPTHTHALNTGSPAIDAATADNTNCGTGKDLETDQRGEPRDDGSCDIGAYEVQPAADPLDYGDAPDGPYPTLLANDGARHDPTGITLGATRDAESDGQPTALADGDGADEDGVTFNSDPSAGFSTTITVNVSANGFLDAWLDLNADGDWLDPGEQIFTSEPVNAGNNVLTLATPQNAVAGDTFARFRVSADGGLDPTGYADNGEVEDYLVTIIDEDTDNDGMTDAYEEQYPDELDPNDPDDFDDDDDGDGLDNLGEFNANTDPGDPDSDGDGIGDAFDNEPSSSGNTCNNGDDTVVSSLNVSNGTIEQCAAESSIEIQSGVTIESGGRLELIAPVVTFGDGFSVPGGAELNVDSSDPTPP